ncbi:pteridine reductase [Thiolapillus brandeum]|uniref:Pteridine reductase n=1 Tax=Thiolapillus brandeum TaxID=1076588 RepID=A0A7U6GJT0_9GAMM|nr:pteridine reductase [Thiolapillus brandeum]BAO44971.1 pteridine reductase [Thiolapillus brandeum]
MLDHQPLRGKTALTTGGAARLGAMSTRFLHAAGANVIIHYRSSEDRARALRDELLRQRADSAFLLRGDLLDIDWLPELVQGCLDTTGRLDVLLNNASNFFPTPVDEATQAQWDSLFGVNAKAPFFLARAAAPALRENAGCIINMVDIHAERPHKNHPIYSMAKAANAMMVKALARELAPQIRVNGVAPGAILWPEGDDQAKHQALPRIPLERAGRPENIARTVLFLATAEYITGQIIAVDGGRSVQQ